MNGDLIGFGSLDITAGGVKKQALPSWDQLHNYQFSLIPDSKYFEDFKNCPEVTISTIHYTTGDGGALFERMRYIRGSETPLTGDDRAELYELEDRLVEYYSETIEHYLAADTDGLCRAGCQNISLI